MTDKLTCRSCGRLSTCELCSRCLLHQPLRRTVVCVHVHICYRYILPCIIKLVTLLCKLKSRPGLALGPLGAPEYESRVNSRSRVPLPTFLCRSGHPQWWSLAEVHGCLVVDSPNP